MAFRSISTNNVIATNLVVTAPAGIADQDILVAWSLNDATSGATTWPSGFTEDTSVSPILLTSFDACTFRYAMKIASGESGNYTITGASQIIGGVAAFSGRVQSTTPHKSSAAKSDTGNASPFNINSAAFSSNTTSSADIFLIAVADGATANITFAAPAGYNLDADISEASPFTRQFMFAHQDGVASGASGATTSTGTGASAAWGVFAVALADGGVQNQLAWMTA